MKKSEHWEKGKRECPRYFLWPAQKSTRTQEPKNPMSSLLVLPGWWGLSDHLGSWLSYVRCIHTWC
jgi:hypothetical protein